MSERISAQELLDSNYKGFLASFILNAVGQLDKDLIEEYKNNFGLDIEIKVNGREVSSRSFLKQLEENFELSVKEAAMEMFKAKLRNTDKALDKINDLLDFVRSTAYDKLDMPDWMRER